jgi:hypothetical protein
MLTLTTWPQLNYAAELLLLLVFALSKVSTGNLIRSISPSKSILRWCLMVQVGVGVWALLALFGAAFQCPTPYWEYSPSRCIGKVGPTQKHHCTLLRFLGCDHIPDHDS